MEPLSEKDLKEFLRQWQAPPAPATLRNPLRRRRQAWWRWWLTGTIRIPAPVGIALVLVMALWAYWGRSVSSTAQRPGGNVASPPSVAPPSPAPPASPPMRDAKRPVIAAPSPPASLAGFRPVDQVELKILRTAQ